MKANNLKRSKFRAEVEGLVFYVSDLEKNYYENWNDRKKAYKRRKVI